MGLNVVPATYDGTVDDFITVKGQVIRLDKGRIDMDRLNKRVDEDQKLLSKLEDNFEESCSGPNLCC